MDRKVIIAGNWKMNKTATETRAFADELKAVGFLFTNDSDGAATSLREAACTVEEIEKLTGFTFFRNLDPDVAREVKGSYDLGDWPGL